MRRRWNWFLIAWPGLPHLWIRGSWHGLAAAIASTALFCVLLASSFVWTAWIAYDVQIAFAAIFGCALVGSAASAVRNGLLESSDRPWDTKNRSNSGNRPQPNASRGGDQPQTDLDNLFLKAQTQYLQGDWAAAERTLKVSGSAASSSRSFGPAIRTVLHPIAWRNFVEAQ